VHEPLQGFSRGFSINAYFLRGDEKPPSCSTAFPQIGIRTQMSYIAQGLMVFEKIEKNGMKVMLESTPAAASTTKSQEWTVDTRGDLVR